MASIENFTALLRSDSVGANITYNPLGGTFTPPFRFRVRFYHFQGFEAGVPAELLDTREQLLTTHVTGNTFTSDSYFMSNSYPQGTTMLQGDFFDATNRHFGFTETIFPQATQTVLGYIPLRREAQHLIRDFTKLNGIQKSAGGTYRTWDIDFISTQALSMAQAARKCRELAQAAQTDPNFSLQYRSRAIPNEEWTARRDATFNEAMSEIARVIEFAVEEVQNRQKFNLVNLKLLRVVR